MDAFGFCFFCFQKLNLYVLYCSLFIQPICLYDFLFNDFMATREKIHTQWEYNLKSKQKRQFANSDLFVGGIFVFFFFFVIGGKREKHVL